MTVHKLVQNEDIDFEMDIKAFENEISSDAFLPEKEKMKEIGNATTS
jgi:hypothetical protein